MNTPVKVDVWSDIACPWCYIGKRRFESGAALFGAPVEVEYHSFQLNPDTPVGFESTEAEFLSRHKGVAVDQAQQMLDHVGGIAESVGLHYHWDDVRHANTAKAHQVIHLAKARGLQLEMVERLFAAYFVEGRNVGDDADLIALAAEIGLDPDEAREMLVTDAQLEAVLADQAQAAALGITGVPFFVIDGKYGVSGAQEAATFADVLRQVVALRDADPSGIAASADDAAAAPTGAVR